tara:strand:+ start:125 stop:664 length:540 start_codon:yes stop_codon:yes gene_type:complete
MIRKYLSNLPIKERLKFAGLTFLLLIAAITIISLMFGGDYDVADNIVDTQQGEENLETNYAEFMSEISLKSMVILESVSSTSNKAANGEINLLQAAELYKLHKKKFIEIKSELITRLPPEKFESVHTQYINALSLLIEGMDLIVIGAEKENVDLIIQGTDKITEATTEINTAAELLRLI